MKENKCKVCTLFNEKNFNEEITVNVNKLIKSKESIEVLNKETGFNLTEYYYKKHRNICLINLELPIEEKIIENEINNKSSLNTLDVNTKIEDYRKQSLENKQNYKLKLLDEIEFLVISTVHHELINGRLDKGFIPKDDISSLKIINDFMKGKFEVEQTEKGTSVLELLEGDKIDQIYKWLEEAKEKKLKENNKILN